MTTLRVLLVANCCVLAGCGGSTPPDANAAYRLVASLDHAGDAAAAQSLLAAELGRHRAVAAVFAHDETIAGGAAAACAAAQRTDVRIVSGLASAADVPQLVESGARAAVCSCAAAPAAIDLALLLCSGISVPKELGLGVQRFTRADLAAGGVHEPAPGDFVLDTLRRQHADTLTTTPAIDVVFRIGLVDGGTATPRGAALRAELIAAAKRYPQLQLDVGAAEATVEQQQATAREFIAQNYNSLLVVPAAPGTLAKVCTEAMAQNIKVVVLGNALGGDAFLCWIGADATALGRAAAAAVEQVLPAGGDVVELKGNVRSLAAARHEAFVRGLGLKGP